LNTKFISFVYQNVLLGIFSLAIFAYSLFAANPIFGQEPVKITLDQAVQMALEHNHALKAARTTILQSQAQEVTASLKPNPVFSWDAQFLPVFHPNQFSGDYLNQTAQFDAGIGYTFERGGKRERRLEAARDQTAVTQYQVSDNERSLRFSVALQFISILLAQSNLDFALENLKSFQNTVDISEARYKAGDVSEGDYLKIKVQLLQFQSDVNMAQLAKAQALIALRQLLGYESIPADYDITGMLDYKPLKANKEDLQVLAFRERPDLQAAQQTVTAAQSQYDLAKANSKQDLGVTLDFMHLGGQETIGLFFNIPLPIFNRNQGEIARTQYAISQAQELAATTTETVTGDVASAYEGARVNNEIVTLYRSGYLDNARESRDISEYAYKRGAASLIDFLDAERSYRSTQLAYRQALASYMLALEQLRQAVGVRSLP
jgi:outer membrane protein, heavy metal efflux system